MATTSEIKAGLDDAANAIRAERNALKSAKQRVTTAKLNLGNIATIHANVVAAIQAFDPATTDPFEQQAIAELNLLIVEFNALQTKAGTAETALALIDFTT